MRYGDALAANDRQPGDVPVMSSGGVTGRHNRANTNAPAVVIGRKGSHGSLWWTDEPAFVIDTAYSIDRSNTHADLRWLFYALSTLRLGDLSNDVGVPGLSREAVYEARLPFASIQEQRRIADFLDDRVSRIDRIIAARREQTRLLDEAVRTRIDALFQKDESERSTRLARFASVQSGLTVDAGRTLFGETVTRPYLRVANVQSDRLDLSDITSVSVSLQTAGRSTLRRGDVLMTEGGDIDKLGRGTVWNNEIEGCLHQNHVFAVRPDQTKLLPRFLALYTRTSAARAYFESTGVQSTNLASTSSAKVLNLPFPVRSLQHQSDAIARYDAFARDDMRVRAALTRQVDLLTEYKSSLITAAVTGELDVTTAGSNILG